MVGQLTQITHTPAPCAPGFHFLLPSPSARGRSTAAATLLAAMPGGPKVAACRRQPLLAATPCAPAPHPGHAQDPPHHTAPRVTAPAGNQGRRPGTAQLPLQAGRVGSRAAAAALWAPAAARSGGLIFRLMGSFRARWAAQSGSHSPRNGPGGGPPSRCCGPLAGLKCLIDTCVDGFYRAMDERGGICFFFLGGGGGGGRTCFWPAFRSVAKKAKASGSRPYRL